MTREEVMKIDGWMEVSGVCYAGHCGDNIDEIAAAVGGVSEGLADSYRSLKGSVMLSDSGVYEYAADICQQLMIPVCSAAVKAVIAFTLGHEMAHANQAKRLINFQVEKLSTAIVDDQMWYSNHPRERDADMRGYPLAQQIYAELSV